MHQVFEVVYIIKIVWVWMSLSPIDTYNGCAFPVKISWKRCNKNYSSASSLSLLIIVLIIVAHFSFGDFACRNSIIGSQAGSDT